MSVAKFVVPALLAATALGVAPVVSGHAAAPAPEAASVQSQVIGLTGRWVVSVDVTGLSPYDATEAEKSVAFRAQDLGLKVLDWHYADGKIAVAGPAKVVTQLREEQNVLFVEPMATR